MITPPAACINVDSIKARLSGCYALTLNTSFGYMWIPSTKILGKWILFPIELLNFCDRTSLFHPIPIEEDVISIGRPSTVIGVFFIYVMRFR